MDEPSFYPGWNAEYVRLDAIDEDELSALVDDVCDNDKVLCFGEEGEDGKFTPLGVALPFERFQQLAALQYGISMMDKAMGQRDEVVEDWHGKAGPSQ